MTDNPERTEAPSPSRSTSQCRDCGSVARNVAWHAGMKCPECGRARMIRVVAAEGAVDFALADRTAGPALEDKRFGQLARWAGMVNINQVVRCMAIQREKARTGEGAPTMGDVMLQEGLITKPQCSGVLHVLAAGRDGEDEKEFGEMVAEEGDVAPDRIAALQEIQQALAADGCQPPPLACLVLENKLASDYQVTAVLKAQRKRDRGLMAEMARVTAERGEAAAQGRALGWRGSPVVGAIAAVAILVSLFFVYRMWAGPAAGSHPANVICEKCEAYSAGKLVRTGPEGVFPMACEACGERAVYPARQCRACGRVFPVKDEKASCPGCGSKENVPVTDPPERGGTGTD